MAITIYNFETWQAVANSASTENVTAYRAELFSWLEDHATDFFDSITLSGETITMTKGDAYLALRVDTGSSNSYNCQKLKNGLLSATTTQNHSLLYQRAVRTGTGIYLCQYHNDTNSFGDLIITKTKSGHTCFLWARTASYIDGVTANRKTEVCVDMDASIRSYCIGYAPNTDNMRNFILYQFTRNADASVLSPLLFSGGETTDNAFVMPFSQAAALEHKKVSIDGVEYFTNGYFALRG